MVIIFEQVFGFACAEKTGTSVTPLQAFMKRVKEELADWEVVIFSSNGQLYLVLVRHRVYIVMVHKDAGGRYSIDMIKLMVQDSAFR